MLLVLVQYKVSAKRYIVRSHEKKRRSKRLIEEKKKFRSLFLFVVFLFYLFFFFFFFVFSITEKLEISTDFLFFCFFVFLGGTPGQTPTGESVADLSGGGFSNYFSRPSYQDLAVKKYKSR